MRKLWYAFSLLAAASLILAACQPAETGLLADIKARGVIKVSTDPNYAPQSFLEPDGDFVGFDIDVAREIGKRLEVEVEFVTPDWDVITAGNWGDQWDISVGSMTITTARQAIMHFTQPYYYTPAQFAAATDSDVQTLEDISGQAVCVGTATTYESWLNGDLEGLGLPAESLYAEAPADVTTVPLTTDADCVQAIEAGREEFAVLLTSNTVVEAALASGAPIRKVGTPVYSEDLAVAIDRNHSKDPASLVEAIDKMIGEMHSDGTLAALSNQWFGADLSLNPNP